MRKFVFLLFLCTIVCSCSSGNIDNYLVYILAHSYGEQGEVILYQPSNDVHTSLLSDWNVRSLSVNENNRLAFLTDQKSIYILDYPFTDNNPRKISSDLKIDALFTWSPNGKYLAFSQDKDNENILSVWNGRRIIDIHIFKERVGEISWSTDGRLAFTEFYTSTFPYDGDPTEIFVWNRNQIMNVSQNPFGSDRDPNWSNDGQLAFLSDIGENRNELFVWDGKSKNDEGAPILEQHKRDTNIIYFGSPTWTNSGLLTFCATSSDDEHHYVQIYEWDGQTTTHISQIPSKHSCGQIWSESGNWAFITFYNEDPLVYIRNNENETIISSKAQYPPAWSRDNFLLFCTPGPSKDWILSMWNDNEIIKIDQGYQIDAVWQNGAGVFCSNG